MAGDPSWPTAAEEIQAQDECAAAGAADPWGTPCADINVEPGMTRTEFDTVVCDENMQFVQAPPRPVERLTMHQYFTARIVDHDAPEACLYYWSMLWSEFLRIRQN